MARTNGFVSRLILVALATMGCAAPVFAARAIQGSVGEVSPADGAALGQVGFRIWSALPGGESNVNDNVSSCRNVRCIRSYITNSTLNPGGYVGNPEATQVYNGDLIDQPFYELADASMNDSAGNHIGFYGVSGVTGNNSGVGSFLAAGCPPPTATNCFGRIDADDAGPVLNNTPVSYGAGPHQIRAISGLNPIPVPAVAIAGGCPFGGVCVTWSDPQLYAGNMRPSTTSPAPPSPVKGVRLYRLVNLTGDPPAGNDPGWIPMGSFDLGQTAFQEAFPPTGVCYFYGLTVRVVGPGGEANEIETYRVGANSFPVCNIVPIRIARFDATYAGHGVVNVRWRTGLEAGLQGFYVTRSLYDSGPYARITDLVPAQGDGHTYSVTDRLSSAARTYYYQLELLDRDGTVTTSASAGVTLPERSRRSGPRIRR